MTKMVTTGQLADGKLRAVSQDRKQAVPRQDGRVDSKLGASGNISATNSLRQLSAAPSCRVVRVLQPSKILSGAFVPISSV